MKKVTLLIFSLFTTLTFFAQVTHQITWQTNTIGNLTINQGDTVEWILGDSFQHTVTSLPGSADNFNSGTIQGVSTKFSHTFNNLGANPYECNFHPVTMTGNINVQVLSIEDEQKKVLELYPNPVSDNLIISSPETVSKITITSVLGKKMLEEKANSNKLNVNMAGFRNGLYFIKIESRNNKQTYRVIKK